MLKYCCLIYVSTGTIFINVQVYLTLVFYRKVHLYNVRFKKMFFKNNVRRKNNQIVKQILQI